MFFQAIIDLDQIIGDLTAINAKYSKFKTLGGLVTQILPYVYGLTGIALLLYLIFGGFKYLTSAGDPKKVESAKTTLTQALIGFIIIFTAFFITQIVDFIFYLQAPLKGP